MDRNDIECNSPIQHWNQSPNTFATHPKTKALVLRTHITSPVTRKTYPGSKNNRKERRKIGGGSFTVTRKAREATSYKRMIRRYRTIA